MNRTDLAAEAAQMLSDKSGIRSVSRKIGGIEITDVRVSQSAAERVGKPAGRYITLEGDPDAEGMTALLQRAIEQLVPKSGLLLAAGLGNPDVTYDTLGSVCVKRLLAGQGRRHYLAAIETDVALRTGIETPALVRAAARECGAACVLAIDALACRSPRYIGRTVQISSAGISPGSGAGGRGVELSQRTVRVPVVALGVPTLTELPSVTRSESDRGYVVTSGDINVVIDRWAEAIGGAINALAW